MTTLSAEASNILETYRSAPRALKSAGLAWYREAAEVAEDVADIAGVTFEQGAAVVAALSPRCSWAENVRWALAVAVAWRDGQDLPRMGLSNSLRRARLALADPSLADIRREEGTLKVRNFWGSIVGERGAVCIDTHAVRIADGRDGGPVALHDAAYRRYADAYREAARVLHRRVADVQAATWVAHRGTHE